MADGTDGRRAASGQCAGTSSLKGRVFQRATARARIKHQSRAVGQLQGLTISGAASRPCTGGRYDNQFDKRRAATKYR